MGTTIIERADDLRACEIRPGATGSHHSNGGGVRQPVRNQAIGRQSRSGVERVVARRAGQRRAAGRRCARAMQSARTEIRRTRYVLVEQREDVMRIMVDRGLSVAEAHSICVEDGDLGPRAAAKPMI